MTETFLGIDMGGTATRWVAVDPAGNVAARGSAAGATGHLFAADARAAFVAAIAQIRGAVGGKVAAVRAGITGLGGAMIPEAEAVLAASLEVPQAAVAASDDMELAFRSCFAPGSGHLVAAGTGSIGLHLTREGEAIRVGGRGILIDDGGSGSWIALTALNRLYRLIDEKGGAGEAAQLAEALFAAVGGTDWDAVRAFVYGSDRGRIGTLAQAVAAAAAAGDAVASEVLAEAADELARLGRALCARAGPLPVGFVGGVLGLSPEIPERLRAALPEVEVLFPSIDAALHAAQMARSELQRS